MILALCLLAGVVGAQAQQVIKGEDINDFTSVSLVGSMSVEMLPADKPGVYMELHGIDPGQVSWNVNKGTLAIKVRPAQQKPGALAVKIYYRHLTSLTSNGADVIFKEVLTEDLFAADMTTGAKLTATLDCRDFTLSLTGNSAAQIEGMSKYITLTANQRSKIDARRCEARAAFVKSYVYSEIYVWSTERLVAETSTGSSVFYRGEPELLHMVTKLGGNVNDIGK